MISFSVFHLGPPSRIKLNQKVWDEDKMKNHDKLGTQRISVMRLVNESGREWPLTLDDAMKDQQVRWRLARTGSFSSW